MRSLGATSPSLRRRTRGLNPGLVLEALGSGVVSLLVSVGIAAFRVGGTNPIFLQLAIKGGFANAKQTGCQEFVTVQLVQRIQNGLFFQLSQWHNRCPVRTGRRQGIAGNVQWTAILQVKILQLSW